MFSIRKTGDNKSFSALVEYLQVQADNIKLASPRAEKLKVFGINSYKTNNILFCKISNQLEATNELRTIN